MALKLYGVEQGFTKVPAFVLYEKNVTFELVPVNMSGGELKTAAYLAKQPFGETPYIVWFPPFPSLLPSKMLVFTKPLLIFTFC